MWRGIQWIGLVSVLGVVGCGGSGGGESNAPLLVFDSFRSGGSSQIYSVKADGRGLKRLTNTTQTNAVPKLDRQADKVTFVSSRDGSDEIYLMNVDGSNQTRLTNLGGQNYNPSFSPDALHIVFDHIPGIGVTNVYRIDADGTGATPLTSDGQSTCARYSPDGTKIVFSSYRTGHSEIWTMNADGSNQVQITHDNDTAIVPVYSVDGTKIFFESNRDGVLNIFSMNADGTGETNLTHSTFQEGVPCPSPDGLSILFDSNQNGEIAIFLMNADGTHRREVYDSGATDADPAFAGP